MKNIIDYNPNFSVRVINGVAKLFISDNGKEKQFKPVNPEPPVPPVPPVPTDRILYTATTQPTSAWITKKCSNNVFDESTGNGYLVLNEGVTELATKLFNDEGDDTNIATVVIPSQITVIGKYTFGKCYGLTSVTIPNSVTSIGKSTFCRCTNLASITIPNSVTYIESSTFDGCTNLASVTIPNSVTSIGANAFRDCAGLTSLTIPDSVTSIGVGAFDGCTGLTSLTIPDSVTSIDGEAFSGCTSLASITCFATTPPTLGGKVFGSINTTTCGVPAGCVAAYEASDWANYFTTFTEIQ